MIEFFVAAKPQPQGSSRAFVIGGKARITSANKNLKPYRQQVKTEAEVCIRRICEHYRIITGVPISPFYLEHVPVRLSLIFTHLKPPSAPKSRTQMVVKPDLDKLIRATCDALTGVVWHDDAQVVQIEAKKVYGDIEGVSVIVKGV